MRLHDFLSYHARGTPRTEFAVDEQRSLDYGDAEQEANRLANAFVAAGLGLGDRVAVLAKNCVDYVVLYYAASKVGVVPVPLNYRLAPPEWEYIINDAGAKLLVARGELVPAVEGVRATLGTVKRCVALASETPAGWESFASFVEGQPSTPPAVFVSEESDVYQMYTSGTTGRPKGAVLTHRAVSAHCFQTSLAMRQERGSRVLIVAPLYHAAAALTAFVSVTSGATLFIQEDFSPVEVVRALDEEGISNATLVPAMIQACLVMVPGVRDRKYESFKQMAYGASPIAAETLRQAMGVFKCEFLQGYGMTETTAVLTYLTPEDHEKALAGREDLLLSAGRPIVGTEIRIVDEDGTEVPPGTVGEICGRGPQLMKGYWNLPDATAEALRGGWMHTGDAGRIDAEGYLYVQDRTKDMIVSGGENVYPREVEDVIFNLPGVADVAVIGVPSDQWGEAVHAIVVPKEGVSLEAGHILEHCKGKLGGFKQPKSVDFIDALPRNPSGKVLKRELREPYWKGRSRRVS